MNIINYQGRGEQAAALAVQVAGQLRARHRAGDRTGLVLSGGSTPAPFMQALAKHTLDWSLVDVTLTDERCVPESHERSNARLVLENLLSQTPAATFLPLYRGDCSDAVLLAGEPALCAVQPIVVCVLGMGLDGHFASLFPEADRLTEGLDVNTSRLTLPMQVPGVPDTRISLTLAAILSAQQLHLLITGAEKLQVLQQAQVEVEHAADSVSSFVLPISHLLHHVGDRLVVHYAD